MKAAEATMQRCDLKPCLMHFAISYCLWARSIKTFTVRLTTMDQPMTRKAEGGKTQEKMDLESKTRWSRKGKSLSNTVDGPFVKSLRKRMGEGKEHELLVQHGVCH